jgi:hypothetical protein
MPAGAPHMRASWSVSFRVAGSIRSTETRSKECVPFQTTSATERSRLYCVILPVQLFQSGRARYLALAMYTRTPLSFSFISIIGARLKSEDRPSSTRPAGILDRNQEWPFFDGARAKSRQSTAFCAAWRPHDSEFAAGVFCVDGDGVCRPTLKKIMNQFTCSSRRGSRRQMTLKIPGGMFWQQEMP